MSCNSFESSCSSRSIERVDSGDTENSAFSSNLVTPTDEDVYLKSGIEERLEISHGVLDYFATGTGSALEEMEGVDQLRLNKVKDITDGKKTTVSHLGELTTVDLVTGVGNELDVEASVLSSYESAQSVASPLSTSSSSEAGLAQAQASIYTLPNAHIVIEGEHCQESDDEPAFEEVSLQSAPSVKMTILNGDIVVAPIRTTWMEDVRPLLSHLTVDICLSFAARMLFFLPWCVGVGAAIVLSPDHLHEVAFGYGYIEPPAGIRRFAHWAEYGWQHVAIFLGLLLCMVWASPSTGLLVCLGLLALSRYTWSSFVVDPTKPLGQDDRQTIYLLATSTWMSGDAIDIVMKDGQIYAA